MQPLAQDSRALCASEAPQIYFEKSEYLSSGAQHRSPV